MDDQKQGTDYAFIAFIAACAVAGAVTGTWLFHHKSIVQHIGLPLILIISFLIYTIRKPS